MHLSEPARVTICIPAYNASRFILETLKSVSSQTYKKFNVLISVDRSDDEILTIIEDWKKVNKDIYIQVFAQNKRLGWLKNMNFLIEKCDTKYFCILPHDDVLHSDYLRLLVSSLFDNSEVCAVYSDIRGFGKKQLLIVQESIIGEKFSRIEKFLKHHFSAVSARGVVNKNILSDQLQLRENEFENFASDTLWVMQQALRGQLVRIPRILYFKRYINDSVHKNWSKWDREKKDNAWKQHCEDCLNLLEEEFTESELNVLRDLCISRENHKEQLLQKIRVKAFFPYFRNPFLLAEFLRSVK